MKKINYYLNFGFLFIENIIFFFYIIAWQTMDVGDILDVITENDEENSESAKSQNEASAAGDIKSNWYLLLSSLLWNLNKILKYLHYDSLHKTM